jgi:hypothetical protein
MYHVKLLFAIIFKFGIEHVGLLGSGIAGGIMIGAGKGIFGRGITLTMTQTFPKSLAIATPWKQTV